jgi:uncharacterized protein (TIGR02996 family)
MNCVFLATLHLGNPMTSDEAFLQAIRDDPEDNAVRLVYADWLEERGDPRGELVRIEEEMRQLPVFGDRYWELKPRRNELRAAVAADWLGAMRYGTDCLPVFGHGVPDGWKERWRLIREFVDRWHKLPLGDVGGRAEEIQETEARLGRTLPPSVREWVAFAHDGRRDSNYHDVLRDVYQMQELEGHSAVSLLLQGEGDYHWAIRHEDFALPDPPVCGFHWDSENPDENTFVPDERNPVAATLTAFALHCAMDYTHGDGGGFGTEVHNPDELIRELTGAFPVRSWFGEMEIFEADNMLVRLQPAYGRDGTRIVLEIAKTLPREEIPAFFWKYTRRGGSFHGMFVPEGKRRKGYGPHPASAGPEDQIPF